MIPQSVADIWSEHRQAGALNELISLGVFVDDYTFITKSGELGVVVGIQGIDYECLDPQELDGAARRFESRLRAFGEDYRLYQYMFKTRQSEIPSRSYSDTPVVDRAIRSRLEFLRNESDLYSTETYFVILYEGWRRQTDASQAWRSWVRKPALALRQRLSAKTQLSILDSDLVRALDAFTAKVKAVLIQLEDLVHPQLLDKEEAFRVFVRLANYRSYRYDTPRLLEQVGLDQQITQSSVECHRDHLRIHDHYLKILSMIEPPAHTFAHMLRALWELAADCIVVSEWRRVSNAQVHRLICSKRRHFHNSKTSLANYLNSAPTSDRGLLIDDADEAIVADLGACLRELEVAGNYFGEWSMTVMLYSSEKDILDRSVAECVKAFANCDATVIEERYNQLNAWLATIPGNHRYNLRRFFLLNTNAADLSFLFTLDTGELENQHLNQEYLAVLKTNHNTPYYLNLHYQDNAHTAMVGATGAGKSFALNFLLTNLQKYQPRTTIFDLGGGYESLTRLFRGSYLKVGLEATSFTINPFSLAPTKENLHFLYSFVRVLLESGGYTLSSSEERDLLSQIENLYQIEVGIRRLLTLRNIVGRRLSEHLDKWVGNGPYASLFDNSDDNLTLASFQCFDFEGMDKYPQVLEPLLFYVLHRANASIHAPELGTQFKVFVMDEAWRFFRNPTIRNYIIDALKTWRKKNAAMILATQSAEDLNSSELLPIILESCATKIFLANPGMDRGTYRELFQLNETEAELIARLIPKQQLLIKRPDISKVLNLHVDPTEYWLYTSNPHESARRREAFERYGFEKGLEVLVQEFVA